MAARPDVRVSHAAAFLALLLSAALHCAVAQPQMPWQLAQPFNLPALTLPGQQQQRPGSQVQPAGQPRGGQGAQGAGQPANPNPVPVPVATPRPTMTPAATPAPVVTPAPTATPFPVATPQPTAAPPVPAATPQATPAVAATADPTPEPTALPQLAATQQPVAVAQPAPTPAATPAPTVVPSPPPSSPPPPVPPPPSPVPVPAPAPAPASVPASAPKPLVAASPALAPGVIPAYDSQGRRQKNAVIQAVLQLQGPNLVPFTTKDQNALIAGLANLLGNGMLASDVSLAVLQEIHQAALSTAGRRLAQSTGRNIPQVDVGVNISTSSDVAWSQLDHLQRAVKNAELATSAGIQGLQTQSISLVSGTVDLLTYPSPPPPVPPAPIAVATPLPAPVILVSPLGPAVAPVVILPAAQGNDAGAGHGLSKNVIGFAIGGLVIGILCVIAGLWIVRKRNKKHSEKEAAKYFGSAPVSRANSRKADAFGLPGKRGGPEAALRDAPDLPKSSSAALGKDLSLPKTPLSVPTTPHPSPDKRERGTITRKLSGTASLAKTGSVGARSPWDAANAGGTTTENPLTARARRARPGNVWDATTAAVTEVQICGEPHLSFTQKQ